MRSLVCLSFCLVLFLLCRIAETRQHSCCLKTNNNRIPENRVVDYSVQKAGVCHIDAIVLWTKRGKAKCYEPDSEWIKDIMRMVDLKKRSKQNSDPKASPSQNRNRKRKRGKGRKQKKTF